MRLTEARETVFRVLREAGLPLTGVASFADFRDRLLPCRAAARLPDEARSVIVTAVSYNIGPVTRNVARFAVPEDYHLLLGARLERAAATLRSIFPNRRFECFVDNSPVPEADAAVAAGLGFRGRHGLLITRDYGSYVVLGEIVTDLPLPPGTAEPFSGSCGDCAACRTACPAPVAFRDKSRCVSRLTQKKGALSPDETELLQKAGFVYGCDFCQDACPRNARAKSAWLPEFRRWLLPVFTPETDPARRAYAWRGREVLLRNWKIVRKDRNGGD